MIHHHMMKRKPAYVILHWDVKVKEFWYGEGADRLEYKEIYRDITPYASLVMFRRTG